MLLPYPLQDLTASDIACLKIYNYFCNIKHYNNEHAPKAVSSG